MKAIHARTGLAIAMAGLVFISFGCGQQSDSAAPERAGPTRGAALTPLGGFVATHQHYAQATERKQEEFQHAQHVAQDRALMEKLSEEYVEIRREWEEKLTAHVNSHPLPWQVQFTALPDRPYTFTSVAITGASYRSGLTVASDLVVDEDMTNSDLLGRGWRTGITLCFKAVDSKGAEIDGTRTCAVADPNRLKAEWVAGSTSSTNFRFGSDEIVRMGDFGGIVEITRAEYQAR